MQLRKTVEKEEVNKALGKEIRNSLWEFLMLSKEDE